MNEPQKTSLDDQLTEFYGSIELPPSTVSEMLADRDRPRSATRRLMMIVGAAAAVVLALLGVFLLGEKDATELAMAEVAKNHLKGIAPEAVSSDYAVVQEHLSLLTFSIEPPAEGLVSGFELVGGRYCKVQGEFAAQLKLRPKHGGPAATAYVVPADGPLTAIEDSSAVIDGVRVRCERTDGRLVFLAEHVSAE